MDAINKEKQKKIAVAKAEAQAIAKAAIEAADKKIKEIEDSLKK